MPKARTKKRTSAQIEREEWLRAIYLLTAAFGTLVDVTKRDGAARSS